MINTSSAYKNTLYNGHRNFIRKASIRLTDNTEIQITDADICQGGFKFDSATTSSGSFEIGNVIIEKFTILLNNRDDKFSTYDFYNATITVYAGIILDDGSEEWLRKGFYAVKEPDFSDSVISLGCYDNSKKFDIPYTNSKLTYPATRKQIVADICQVCGVTDNTGEFDGYNETVETRPEDNNLSCRDILSFIAQISGLYGRCDNTGGFKFAWYEKIQYEGNNSSSESNLDGGNFTDYSSGDTADGGNFTDYSSGDSYDGGTLVRNSPDLKGNFHNIYSTASSKPSTDDITITGIKVVTTTVKTVITTTKSRDPDTGETTTETTSSEETIAFEVVSGSNEYMLVVTDNPLVNDSNAQSIADHLYSKIGGMTFRPMTLSALADPSMEAGDAMVFTDRKGNSYESYITTLSYTMGQYANMTCDAETPLSRKKNSETISPALKNAIEMENAAEKKYTRYAQAVDQLNQIAANALGFYETTDIASDGSKIVYMHDKPKLEDSEIVYKRSIDGFFISRDGGETYTAGFDSNGNAVVNILSAIGINFDWAYGGTLTLGGDANGNGVLNIVDENGNPIVVGDNNGLVIYKGKISFSDVTDSDGNTLEDRISGASSSGGITEEQVTEITRNEIKSAKISANQIYGNTLTLGGSGNANGILVINDANGNPVVTGNKDGLVINKGSISWSNVTGTDDVATTDDIPTEEQITQITKNTVTTTYVNALKVTAKSVETDAIKSKNYSYSSGNYSNAGTFLDLSNGALTSKNFAISSTGEAYFNGEINATSGKLKSVYIQDSILLETPYGKGALFKADKYDIYLRATVDPDGVFTSGMKFNCTAFFDKYVDFNGDCTFYAQHILKRGSYVHSATGESGSKGYVKIAEIDIVDVYCNVPIIMHIIQRDRAETVLSIWFNNENSTDPTLKSFTYYGGQAAYLVKSSASTWGLYVQKSEAYDNICVSQYYISPHDREKMNVTWKNVHASSLPSGYTASTAYIANDSEWITISSFLNSFAQASTSWTSTCMYRKIGNHVYLKGCVKTPSSWANSASYMFQLPVGYRPNTRKYVLNPMTLSRIARIYVDTNGYVSLEWTKNLSDGSNVSGELSWVQIDMDFLID